MKALACLLGELLTHYRRQAQRGDRLRDEQFEAEVIEMGQTLAGYREILIPDGLLTPGSPSSRTH